MPDLRRRRRAAQLAALLAAPIALAGCDARAPAGWSGYAEGDYVYVAAPLAGRLETLAVHAGQPVQRGALLFTLDDEAERAARDEALARAASARAQAADTESGRRRDEIAVTEAQLAQARAQAALAATELARQQQLLAQGFVSQARIDDAQTAVTQARARVAELEAALRVARLPARADTRAAAVAQAEAASQAVRASDWRTEQKQQHAPVDAQVADTYFHAGEFVPAGQPVLALLPPAAVKARFYVPEDQIATLAAGQRVTLACDGCGTPIPARVSRIATRAEYTPPVIYSNAQRARLVFLVEAQPDAQDAPRLRPGQPLDVHRAAP
ncbi:MAG: HlyD family efflux transporter periplasmic adaptor subunit [Piscinibacter sp.]|nr:HlyD family efflux transporter periplasmic adaptor subunit [Piscinibacter sp.]